MIRGFSLLRTLSAPLTRRLVSGVSPVSFARQNLVPHASAALENRSFSASLLARRSFATAAPPSGDVALEKHESLLRMVEQDADSRPSDVHAQLLYLKALIRSDQVGAALARFLGNPSLLSNPEVAAGMLQAMQEQIAAAKANPTLAKDTAAPAPTTATAQPTAAPPPTVAAPLQGTSPRNPLHVQMSSGWAGVLSTVVTAVLAGVIIYSLFFKGGGIGDMFNSPSMTVSVENNVETKFSDVKGCDEAKEELSDIVEYLRAPEKFQRLRAKMPKGILLTGPPGCGKTLMARALAGEAGVPFYYASGSEFEEMLVGVGARRVRSLFKKAKETSPCIIFLDEIDAVGGKRDDRENRSKMTLNQLLVELDGFTPSTNVIVIAATNMPETLDPALTRPGRFDRQVGVTLPDVRARKDIINHYLADRQSEEVNVEELSRATVGFSGADLFNMINTAAIEATKLNLTKVTMRLLRSALDHVAMGPHRKSMIISEQCRRNTAFHEAGHALVSLHTPGSTKINKATLAPRGQALGMVSSTPNDELQVGRHELLAQLDMAMGGRVAEELIFGKDKVTTGASNDFEQATRIATAMVTRYGMSDVVGPMAFNQQTLRDASGPTREKIDSEVRQVLEDSYARAKNILMENNQQLHYLANALLEYETLSLDDINVAITGRSLKAIKDAQKSAEEALIAAEQESAVEPASPPSQTGTALPGIEDADEVEGRGRKPLMLR
eukprot:TRINITY_DN5822_c0_g1_i1.p1 TRINITY_DN5822_c0_g1~~TRINITY_DN5822_c0_g1_i1.p1  ORF type:complete len:725 (-),score=266.05 TRINITY_DN5822_c0_g1_i1:395-2569(-)